MDTKEIKTLCLKHAYGATLTESERSSVDDYARTAEGKEYLQECREVKTVLKNVADVEVKPVDEEAMIQEFERTVRQTFTQTVLRPRTESYSPPVILGLVTGLFIIIDGGSVIAAGFLGFSVLWMIVTWFQRYYFRKLLSRPDLYEYAKASRRRSDRILKSLPGLALVAVLSGLATAAISYSTYLGYQAFGFIVPAIVLFVIVEAVAIFIYQYRKVKRSDSEVWDWWAEELTE